MTRLGRVGGPAGDASDGPYARQSSDHPDKSLAIAKLARNKTNPDRQHVVAKSVQTRRSLRGVLPQSPQEQKGENQS